MARAGFYFTVAGVQNDFCGQQMTLVEGTPEDGTWQATCTVTDDVRIGTYTVVPYAQDAQNNHTNVNGGRDDDTRASFVVE